MLLQETEEAGMAILILDSTRQLFAFNDDGTNPEFVDQISLGHSGALDGGDMAFVPLYGGRLMVADAGANTRDVYAFTAQGARLSNLDLSGGNYTGVAYYNNNLYALNEANIEVRGTTPDGWGGRTVYQISGALLQDRIGMGYHATRQILLCDDGGLIYSYKLNTAATPDRWERNPAGDAQLSLAVGETVNAFDVNDKTVHAVIAVPAVPPPNPKAARQEVRVYTLA